jgi:hypothetical protein
MENSHLSHPQNLYEVLIEELGLSEHTIEILHRIGVTYIGDCIDFFNRAGRATPPSNTEFIGEMYDAVLPELEKHGYWPRYKMDDDEKM